MEKEKSIMLGLVAVVALAAVIGLFIPFFSFDNNVTGEAFYTGLRDMACVDDDGADVHRKTMVAYGNKKLWDQCGSSLSVIVEATCDVNGRAVRMNMQCPKNEVCREGACVPETMSRPGRIARTICFDPDAENIFVRSEVSTYTERLLDQCMSTSIIQEATCGINGEPSFAMAGCPKGYACLRGACKKLNDAVI